MRALRELGTVIVAGFVAFFTGCMMIGALLILWFLGLVSALMLMVSAFGGVMYLTTGKAHNAHVAVVYRVCGPAFRGVLCLSRISGQVDRWPAATGRAVEHQPP
jgi:hypothetical protein